MINIQYDSDSDWRRIVPHAYERIQIAVGLGEPVVPVPISRNEVFVGDAVEKLKTLPSASVDCVITSPPYWNLRDYGCDGQIGLEDNIDAWVASLGSVFTEVARVLKPGGGLWLNIGDSFSPGAKTGVAVKGMVCAPERLLLTLAEDGWIVRSKVIWSKTNVMPNGVADRLNVTYEPIYFLVRSPRYYFDLNAIREPRDVTPKLLANALRADDGTKLADALGDPTHPILGANPGDVWRIPTKGFKGAHFATFPSEIVRRPLLATCPEAICTKCGLPWKRSVRTWRVPLGEGSPHRYEDDGYVMRFGKLWNTLRQSGDLIPCGCGTPTVRGIVLDPFFGAGTVGLVAEEHGRDWIGIEINPDYADLAWNRIKKARGGPCLTSASSETCDLSRRSQPEIAGRTTQRRSCSWNMSSDPPPAWRASYEDARHQVGGGTARPAQHDCQARRPDLDRRTASGHRSVDRRAAQQPRAAGPCRCCPSGHRTRGRHPQKCHRSPTGQREYFEADHVTDPSGSWHCQGRRHVERELGAVKNGRGVLSPFRTSRNLKTPPASYPCITMDVQRSRSIGLDKLSTIYYNS
jgi:DNA modification methylase